MLHGAIGYIGGQEVVITHRNPFTGELWCEGKFDPMANEFREDAWVDPDRVSFSKNPTL